MDERRREPREAKRVMLTFVRQGDSKVTRGIATSVSKSGLFITTGTLFPKGTILVVTVTDDPGQKGKEFEVRNVHRFGDSPGMGLRVVKSGVRDATGAFAAPPERAPEPVPEPAPKPASTQNPAAQDPSSTELGPLTPTRFALHFPSVEKYVEALRRDIKRGGAFIAASLLPPQDAVVMIEIAPPMPGARRVVVEARVVFRSEPGPGRPSGFGVEFLERERVLASLPDPEKK